MCGAPLAGSLTGMTSPRISRRRLLLRGTATAAAVAAGLPLLDACTSQEPSANPTSSSPPGPAPSTASGTSGTDTANVRVNNNQYGVHVEPSVAANTRSPGRLLAACQASPNPDPEFVSTYLSLDAGATWQPGGIPQPPAGAAQSGDDVTVAFDTQGRGYVCATSTGGGRAVYVWRTDDGGRTFSAPVTLVAGAYCDHPWLATGADRHVYVVWGAGNKSALDFARSTDGGETFEAARTILANEGNTPALSAGPALAAGPNGLVCAVCDRMTKLDASGEVFSHVVAVCSTDGGRSFGPPVDLGEAAPIISLPGGVLPDSSPTVAAAPDGALYVAFTRHRPGAPHSDIVVTASHDSGRTWSQPVAATPAETAIYFQPNLTVDDAGRVGISAFALKNGKVDVVLLVSQPRELRFDSPRVMTTTAFDPTRSPTSPGKHGAWWIGDYQGITSGGGLFHLVWNDTRAGKLELFAASAS
jgi:hypothetical protein